MTEKIRIKDLAERAGVSVGTVDRVLHKRPNVSPDAKQKVERAIEEMHYQPNMYASALAHHRTYTFVVFLPEHEGVTYWDEIENGTRHAMENRRDFRIDVQYVHYTRFDDLSFRRGYRKILDAKPAGVIVVPSSSTVTREFADELHRTGIPFILLDSYMPDLKPLSFFGQDSYRSGMFAAKMLMLLAHGEQEVMLMRQVKNGLVSSLQQARREMGFRDYMAKFFNGVAIATLDLPMEATEKEFDGIIATFLKEHSKVRNAVTFTSKAYIVGEYFMRHHLSDMKIMGYDMIDRNVQCIREGSVSFIIAQHAFLQGYYCIDTLFRHIVLKMKVKPVNYMPIELLSRENCDFYQREQI